MEKALTEKEILTAIQAVVSEIANAKNTLKNKAKMISEIMPEIIAGLRGKSFEKVANILFQKQAGKMSFYAENLKDFFEANNFALFYNTRKKIFYWIGDFSKLEKASYLDFLEDERESKRKDRESLPQKEKILLKYKSIEKLKKAELEILLESIKSLLKNKI